MDSAFTLHATENISGLFDDDISHLFGDWNDDFDVSSVLRDEYEVPNLLQDPDFDEVAYAEVIDATFERGNSLTEHSIVVDASQPQDDLPRPIAPAHTAHQSPGKDSTQENSCTKTENLESCESRNATSGKRRWNDSVIVFSATDGKDVIEKKRKAFSSSRKKEVALNRLVGACIPCRIRRGSCDFSLPCHHCVKKAGSITMGQEICTRQSLVATRFDRLDLFSVSVLESKAQGYISTPIAGSRRTMYVGYNDAPWAQLHSAFIKVTVMDFDNQEYPSKIDILYFNYYSCEAISWSNSATAISRECLPSVDRLVEAYGNLSHWTCPGPFSALQGAFRDFANHYCNSAGDFPLKQLLTKVLRMKTLLAIFKTCPDIRSSPDDRINRQLSTAVFNQLKALVSKEIVAIEITILAQVDRLVYRSQGMGRENPLALWICLWILILSYKDHMVFADIFHSQREYYDLTRHIYNNLTTIYASLYRTTSPLTFDWRTAEIAGMLGNDPTLVTLFCNIKTEMYWFQANADNLYSEDALFKTLVVDNETKLVRAHIKAAKRQGIL